MTLPDTLEGMRELRRVAERQLARIEDLNYWLGRAAGLLGLALVVLALTPPYYWLATLLELLAGLLNVFNAVRQLLWEHSR